MVMIIALNGKILETTQPAGPEMFTYNLYKELLLNYKQHKFVIYYKNDVEGSFLQKLKNENSGAVFTQISDTNSWTHFNLPTWLIRDRPDYYFSPEHTLPIFMPGQTQAIVMIHGLEMISNKQLKRTNWKFYLQWNLLKRACKVAKLVVVPSEYTKLQLVEKKVCTDINKINILPEGISNDYRIEYSENEIYEVKKTYGINYKYLLFVSTLQPRKNIVGTIKAYAKSLGQIENQQKAKLLLVGKKGWNYEEIFEIIEKLNLTENVKYLNWVPQEHLPKLFAGATGFVNFSFEEGFSLTLAQAMASKILCAVSDIDPHKVLGGSNVFYADPNNINQMAESLTKLLTASSLEREEKINKAKEISENYTWEKTAEKFISLLEQHQTHS